MKSLSMNPPVPTKCKTVPLCSIPAESEMHLKSMVIGTVAFYGAVGLEGSCLVISCTHIYFMQFPIIKSIT
jgi:hypothetical protein